MLQLVESMTTGLEENKVSSESVRAVSAGRIPCYAPGRSLRERFNPGLASRVFHVASSEICLPLEHKGNVPVDSFSYSIS